MKVQSLVFILILIFSFGCKKEQPEHPNVLFIICDDLNDNVYGLGSLPEAITPNIDRLSKKGVYFTNAHSNCPICAPSRKSLLTGLHPDKSKMYDFKRWSEVPAFKGTTDMITYFKNNGYQVFGTGKIFHNDGDHMDVWKVNDSISNYGYGPDLGPFPFNGKNIVHHPIGNATFDSLANISHIPWAQSFAPLSDVPSIEPDLTNDIPGFTGWYCYGNPFKYNSETDRDLMPDELHASYAADILKKEHDKPFFMAVGFLKPHAPLYAPKKYFDMYPLDNLQLPPRLENDTADCVKTLKRRDHYGYERFNLLYESGGEDLWKKWVQAYLACATFVDDQLGTILDALEKSKYSENTIVIFTSDHGHHMGEKDYIFKNTVWEESTRVPFIIKAPGVSRKNETCKFPVSLLDIYPTLLDLCNLSKEPNKNGSKLLLDGRSLRPYITNPEKRMTDIKEAIITSITDPVFSNNQQIVHSIRTLQYRYILSGDGDEELYDHSNDPLEQNNLIKNTDYLILKDSLNHELKLMLNQYISNK